MTRKINKMSERYRVMPASAWGGKRRQESIMKRGTGQHLQHNMFKHLELCCKCGSTIDARRTDIDGFIYCERCWLRRGER